MDKTQTKNITIFKNIRETSTPFHRHVGFVLDRIKSGSSKTLVKKIRNEKDKSLRNELKKDLPAICFSGRFVKRTDNSIQEHSGFICLDFDGYAKQKDLVSDKEKLSKDRYVYSVFISPSGAGLKALIKIPNDVDNHVNYFNSLEKYFDNPHFDKTSKNISRVCYESYDPLIFINENSSLWEKIDETQYEEVTLKDPPTIPITDENKIVDILVKWWVKKYPMSEGQRNQHAYVLAMAFNDFGVYKSLAMSILRQYSTEDFNQDEIDRTINSAYSRTDNFGTKYYEDEEKINSISNQLKRGASKKEIRSQLKESKLESDVIEAVLNRIEVDNEKQVFWTKSDKGVIKIEHIEFKRFLEDNGFYKFCPEGGKNYVFVKVTNNLIDHTSEKEIKDFILEYLLELGDSSIYNFFAECTRYFREEFLTLLATIDIYFVEDTKDASYLYYLNCSIRITKKGVTVIDYLDLGGYVWKDHVIDRNFSICDIGDCHYTTFIGNICNNEKERVMSMESTIGYMMHGYKNLSYCPAVILNDEVISDNPEGGTGKGLFMNALSHMKKLIVIDGKAFAFERSFPYQLVSADTQILCFDDVKKNFDFERLFSVVTEGLTLEKKNKDAIKIPFSRSPKIAITTNYAIKGAGNSFARRKWDLELHQHYNKYNTPIMEFKKHFFADWDDTDWCKFDNYMVSCLKQYLKTGLIETKLINNAVKVLSENTSHDFIEWCGLVKGNEVSILLESDIKTYKHDIYVDFITEYPDYAPKGTETISRTKFYKWVVLYAKFKYNIDPEEGRDSNRGRWIKILSEKPESLFSV
jgi:SOS response regulatory protein OraA/RecX